jgi:cyclic beta-1,2-glucan synthetase
MIEGQETGPIQIETDRAKFIGRGRSIAGAAMTDTSLSGTTGTVLDPISSIRRRVSIPPGSVTPVTFWTMVADTPDVLLELVVRPRDPSAFGRAATLAWTRAQVQRDYRSTEGVPCMCFDTPSAEDPHQDRKAVFFNCSSGAFMP